MTSSQESRRRTPEHLEDVSDGGGCAEMWEAISEAVEAEAEETEDNTDPEADRRRWNRPR
jgi:hypothetical protein